MVAMIVQWNPWPRTKPVLWLMEMLDTSFPTVALASLSLYFRVASSNAAPVEKWSSTQTAMVLEMEPDCIMYPNYEK